VPSTVAWTVPPAVVRRSTASSAADCYCDPPILRLRGLADAAPSLLTFTGGSGGSVKTVFAASRLAAAQLVSP